MDKNEWLAIGYEKGIIDELPETEQVYKFMNNIILHSGKITRKEYLRIYQIVNNVMLYASDLNIGHARAINWGIVKRYIAIDHFTVNGHQEFCVPETDRKNFSMRC